MPPWNWRARIFGSLDGKTVMIVGAGKMSELSATSSATLRSVAYLRDQSHL
jgi:glutamyl-tRNA reductase